MKKEIVIIGAGPSGLTAALEILRRSDEYKVTVLEESENIGGISTTIETEGGRMDIGGHRFYTKSERVQRFWDSLMPRQGSPSLDEIITCTPAVLFENGADPQKTDKVMLNRRRVSRIYRGGKFYEYPISFQSIKTMGFGAVSAGMSYLLAQAKKKKENTLEDFYINRFGKKLYSTFFESYTEKVWGVHPSELSPDWGAQRVRSLSVRSVVKDMLTNGKTEETSLIKRFFYPKFGPGQLWEYAAKKIEQLGGTVVLGSTAEKVKIRDGKVVSVKAADKEYKADILISSMPLSQLIGSIVGDEPLDEVKKTAENLHFRDFITVGVLVSRLKIKNRTKLKTVGDIPPDCWIYVQDKDVKMGRLQIFNNWSPYMVKDYENKVFIGTEYFCSEGDKLWSVTDSQMCEFAVSELEKIGVIEKGNVSMTHCVRMKKAYPSYNGSYGELAKIREYADNISNLYCVGRNGQHRYNNMDHSMLTAMTAADVILEGGDKSSVWTVNPDGEYGE